VRCQASPTPPARDELYSAIRLGAAGDIAILEDTRASRSISAAMRGYGILSGQLSHAE